ncbi:hypothetical protein EYZ11_010979 [Aspergillus tanneri]|uniref:Uncharacterized protein n=1 Tax=Aspergillus tanneri TaxID=1220188 RepID=A0A4S3J415_9EURO|nr:hypothetical protein EYZ11_010979 [Aspergillus tanneri]
MAECIFKTQILKARLENDVFCRACPGTPSVREHRVSDFLLRSPESTNTTTIA